MNKRFTKSLCFGHLHATFSSGEGGQTLSIVVTPYLAPFTAATGMFFPLFLERIVGILEFISFTLRKLKLFLAVLNHVTKMSITDKGNRYICFNSLINFQAQLAFNRPNFFLH